MKKANSKHLKSIMAFLLVSVLTQFHVQADILKPLPNVDDASDAIKNELYGAEITSCQQMSGGWKGSSPDFEKHSLRVAREAAIKFNKTISDAADDIETFTAIGNFIDFDQGEPQLKKNTLISIQRDTGGVGRDYYVYYAPDLEQTLPDRANHSTIYCAENSKLGLPCILVDKLKEEHVELTYPLEGRPVINEKQLKEFLDEIGPARRDLVSEMEEAIEEIARCSALYAVVSNGVSARGMNYSDFNKSQESKSFDGKLKCSSIGYETQDYKACNEAVNYYDAVFVGRKAVETAQSFQYMDKSMDIQTDMAKNAQTDATAGLKAQKQDIQTKAEMARTRAATETAAVGALWAAMGTIPDLEGLASECNAKIESLRIESQLKEFEVYYNGWFANLGLFPDKPDRLKELITANMNGACQKHVGNPQTANHALIQNSEAKGIIQQALIDAGMNIATMLGTAEILDKQAGRVGDAIKLVEDHEPESLAYTGEDMAVTECQVNPNSENCVSAQYERGVGYHNDGISVSGMQFATSDSTLPIDDTTTRNTDGASDSTDRGGSVGGIGAPIDPISKGSGLADDPVAAASVAATGANGLGAGGGGGSSSGASGGASAPANGSARTGGQGANKPYVGSSKKLKYSSGGGLSFSSGSKRRVASKSKAENPFSKLFGKKNGNKNGVLNFRGVASDVGSKNGSIFQMISKRYSAVNKDNRLQEYTKK